MEYAHLGRSGPQLRQHAEQLRRTGLDGSGPRVTLGGFAHVTRPR